MPCPPEVEERLVELLAHIYRAVPWSKFRTRHGIWDIWDHRVRAAAARGRMGEFVSTLCNYFGLQSLPEAAMPIVEALRPDERAALRLCRTEHIPIAQSAVVRSKVMWEEWRAKHPDRRTDGPIEADAPAPEPPEPTCEQGSLFDIV